MKEKIAISGKRTKTQFDGLGFNPIIHTPEDEKKYNKNTKKRKKYHKKYQKKNN